MKKKILFPLLFAAIVLVLFSVRSSEKEYTVRLTGELGTVSEVMIFGNKKAAELCENYIKSADDLFSVTKPQSEISRLNSGENVELSPDTAEILDICQKYADKDSFNPFAGALFEVWTDAITSETIPTQATVSQANAASYPISLRLDGNSAMLENPAQKINLGAIAKGYITNKLVDILKNEGVGSALINLGGNIYAHGHKPSGENWQIAVRSPDSDTNYIGVLSLADTAVVTSGDYERYFEANGERYHHIIDLKTGYPAKSGLRSVTIICQDAAVADMLSTKCFVLGFENAKELPQSFNAAAIFVTEQNEVYYSSNLSEVFSYDNPDYTYSAF